MSRRHSHQRRISPEVVARKAAHRQALLDAADRAIRRDGPEVSMTAIAVEAGTAKPVLYRYFGDKGGLYQALAERYVRQIMEAVREGLAAAHDPKSRLRAAIDAYVALVESSPDVYRFLMHRAVSERAEAQATVADFIRQLGTELAAVFGDELRNRGLDSGAAEPWARGIVGMVQVAGDWWMEDKTMSRESLVDYLVALLWDGLVSARPVDEATDVRGSSA
jgi:AcrR family transcriptional regulator